MKGCGLVAKFTIVHHLDGLEDFIFSVRYDTLEEAQGALDSLPIGVFGETQGETFTIIRVGDWE
jgi:hypothetical protein